MPSFDEAWLSVAIPRDGEIVSSNLRPFLRSIYLQVLSDSLDKSAFKKSLDDLLVFLSRDGRTNANCWAVDMFFGKCAGWERSWGDMELPEEFHDVLAMMGEALHDSVKDPNIAENFGCLPEQLLERVRNLRTD